MKKIKTNVPIRNNPAKIIKKITAFWDRTSQGWWEIWGPHIHHGYFEENEVLTTVAAQERLIEKLVSILSLNAQDKVLDVGCGMGGSSIYLAEKYQAAVTGVTLSQKQIDIATEQLAKQQVKNVNFKIADAHLLNQFADESFDVIWSLESCEQFYDKALFLKQAYRVLKPDGKIMLATWCSNCAEFENQLAAEYQALCVAFDTPYMPTIDYYMQILNAQNFKLEQSLDWSSKVKNSWSIGLSHLQNYSFLHLFRLGGFKGLWFLRKTKLMQKFFEAGHIKYGVFIAKK